MNKSQRVEAAIKGQSVDRIPFSVWYHMSGGPGSCKPGGNNGGAD